MLLKQKVMFISQTSLKITHASPDVPKRYFRLRAWDLIVGTSKLFWYIYRLYIYIVSTYVHTRTLHDCSLAPGALANNNNSDNNNNNNNNNDNNDDDDNNNNIANQTTKTTICPLHLWTQYSVIELSHIIVLCTGNVFQR